MNIYLFELRSHKLWTWLIGIGGCVIVMMSAFSSLSADATEFDKFLEGFSPAIRSALSMDIGFATSALGFFGFSILYAKILGAMQAMLWGATLITKERRFHTAEFLLSKPRTRTTILTAKIAASLTGLLITNIFLASVSTIMLSMLSDGYDVWQYVQILLGFAGLQVVYFSLGLVIAVVFEKLKNPLSVALGTVFGTYILGVIGTMSDDSKLLYLSPFKYFEPTDVLRNGHYAGGRLLVALLLTTICILVSFMLFRRRDVK